MPLLYSPKRVTPKFHAIESAQSLGELKQAMTKLLHDLTNEQNQERARVASALNATGGIRGRYRVIADEEAFANNTDATIGFDTTGNDVTVTLPLTTEYPGMQIRGIIVDASNAAKFAPRGSESIDGVAGAYTLSGPVVLQADETAHNWVVVS